MTKRFLGGLDPALPALYGLLAPALFLPGLVDVYVLPRASLAVLAGGAMGGLALYRAATSGAAPRLRGLGWPTAAVALAALLAAVTSVNPWLSVAGAYTRYESVVMRLAYLGLLVGAVVLAGGSRRAGRRIVAAAFVAGSCIAAAIAIVQLLTHSLPRPDGNLGQPNLLGALLAMAIPLSLQLGFRFWPALATLPVLCFGLFASSSRSGWLAALAGCLVVLIAILPVRARRAGAALALALALGAVALIVLSPLRNLNSDTGSARQGVWADGLRMVAARPLTGWGEEATGLVFGRFQSQNWEPGDAFDRIHNQPLDLLATQGLAGLAACAWLWAVIAWAAIAALRRSRGGTSGFSMGSLLGALSAYSVWSLLNFDWAPATGPFWLLGGLVWAEVHASAEIPHSPTSTDQPASWVHRGPALAGAAALSALGLALAAGPILADRAYFEGAPRRAVALDPLQAQYQRVLGEALGHTPAGLGELERARDLGEYDYQFFIELGDLALELGRPAEARAAYERAQSIYPFDPTAAQRLRAMGLRRPGG